MDAGTAIYLTARVPGFAAAVAIAKLDAIGGLGVRLVDHRSGLHQTHADQAAVLVDPLDHIPVELELADDDGGEVDPAGTQLVKGHWLVARAPESLERPKLLGFSERHRHDSSPVLLSQQKGVAIDSRRSPWDEVHAPSRGSGSNGAESGAKTFALVNSVPYPATTEEGREALLSPGEGGGVLRRVDPAIEGVRVRFAAAPSLLLELISAWRH